MLFHSITQTVKLLPFFLAAPTKASVTRRQDPGFQTVPNGLDVKAPGTFSNGAPGLYAEPPITTDIPPAIYGARSIDIPFGRLFHGNLSFFSEGQLNTPTGKTDVFVGENDNANQSACGIPDNAFFVSKVAIHPYFLKYADLSRYCMQDVCISFWKNDGSSDMMLKVTDICSTDPNDPTACLTPTDIKIDRAKASIMEGYNGDPSNPNVVGNRYAEPIWWFFMKCWDDGLAQPAYQGNNWFTDPSLPNNLQWAQQVVDEQYKNNQISYPANGWEVYPPGAYNTERDDTTSPPILDWVPGQEPAWSPVAGGLGWGNPIESNSAPSKPSESSPQPPPTTATLITQSNPISTVTGVGSSFDVLTLTTSTTSTAAGSCLPSSTVAATLAAEYAQCGGQGWTGPTTCVAGYTCQPQIDSSTGQVNIYYSQCL